MFVTLYVMFVTLYVKFVTLQFLGKDINFLSLMLHLELNLVQIMKLQSRTMCLLNVASESVPTRNPVIKVPCEFQLDYHLVGINSKSSS